MVLRICGVLMVATSPKPGFNHPAAFRALFCAARRVSKAFSAAPSRPPKKKTRIGVGWSCNLSNKSDPATRSVIGMPNCLAIATRGMPSATLRSASITMRRISGFASALTNQFTLGVTSDKRWRSSTEVATARTASSMVTASMGKPIKHQTLREKSSRLARRSAPGPSVYELLEGICTELIMGTPIIGDSP